MLGRILKVCLCTLLIVIIIAQYSIIKRYDELSTEQQHDLHIAIDQIEGLQEQLIAALPPDPDIGNYGTHYNVYDIALSADLQAYTYAMCDYYSIVEYYELVLAVMQHESRFVDTAVSSTNDYGLMQINRCNLQWLESKLGITNIMDPYQNIHAGIYILSGFLHKYDSEAAALMCYNMGEGGAKELWKQGIDNSSYSNKVLAIYKEYIG